MASRKLAPAVELQKGDRVLLIDDPDDGHVWAPGKPCSYYTVITEPERRILDIGPPGEEIPRPTRWMLVGRPATPDDPAVWSDGTVTGGALIRRAFFVEHHTVHMQPAAHRPA